MRGVDNVAEFFSGMWEHMGSPMRSILFRWCRLEKDDSDNGSSETIKAILKARGRNCRIFNQHVEGQMMMILAALCRSVENLHGDMSYVIIEGPMWKIRQRQWSWWRWSSFWRWRFNLGHLWRRWVVKRRHRKGLLSEEVEAAKNTNKDKTARHKKVEAMALIPC